MFTIHLKRNTGNPEFQPGGSTAAVNAVGTRKGKLNGRTITARKPGTLPHDVMASAKYDLSTRVRKPRVCHLSLLFGMTRAL